MLDVSRAKNLVIPSLLLLTGLGALILIVKSGVFVASRVEIISDSTSAQTLKKEIVVEASGEVIKPGVYKLISDSRVEDLLIASGGFSESADRGWIEKNINRAGKLTDGQKIYIPSYHSVTTTATNVVGGSGRVLSTESQKPTLTNINTDSLSKLDKLPGIGPVFGQSIIDHRPYSSVEDLSTKNILKKNVYEKIKDLVTVN